MQYLIMFIGMLMISFGLYIMFKPTVIQSLLSFFERGKNLYIAGVIRFILAIIFFISATQCSHPAVIIGLGILMLLAAILVFTIPLIKLKAYLLWWNSQGDFTIRILGLFPVIFGAIIIWASIIK